jgi:hypothetical protein
VNIAAALPAPALGSWRWILSSRDRSGKNARINHFIVWSIGMGAAKSSDKYAATTHFVVAAFCRT